MQMTQLPEGADRPLPVSLSFPRPTHLGLLPGRGKWLHVCHGREVLAGCDDCLRRVAEFLAREMQFALERALEKSTGSYRAELGSEICSTERAAELRRFTCQACLPARAGLALSAAAEANWVEQMRLAREFDGRERAALAKNVVAFPSATANTEILREAQDDTPKKWVKVRNYVVNGLLWTALITAGGIFFVGLAGVLVLAACAGEDL